MRTSNFSRNCYQQSVSIHYIKCIHRLRQNIPKCIHFRLWWSLLRFVRHFLGLWLWKQMTSSNWLKPHMVWFVENWRSHCSSSAGIFRSAASHMPGHRWVLFASRYYACDQHRSWITIDVKSVIELQAPQSADSWTGVLDTLEYGPVCIQKKQEDVIDHKSLTQMNDVLGTEDCLFMNVFVPGNVHIYIHDWIVVGKKSQININCL